MIGRQQAVLLGRSTYDQWSRYWPSSQEQPFADFINSVPKYVLTSGPLGGDWNRAEPLARAVADLKARVSGDIGVHGSISVARSLLQARLVDELCLAVGRVLDPVGRRLFAGIEQFQEFRLLQAVPTPSGSLWLRYEATS